MGGIDDIYYDPDRNHQIREEIYAAERSAQAIRGKPLTLEMLRGIRDEYAKTCQWYRMQHGSFSEWLAEKGQSENERPRNAYEAILGMSKADGVASALERISTTLEEAYLIDAQIERQEAECHAFSTTSHLTTVMHDLKSSKISVRTESLDDWCATGVRVVQMERREIEPIGLTREFATLCAKGAWYGRWWIEETASRAIIDPQDLRIYRLGIHAITPLGRGKPSYLAEITYRKRIFSDSQERAQGIVDGLSRIRAALLERNEGALTPDPYTRIALVSRT